MNIQIHKYMLINSYVNLTVNYNRRHDRFIAGKITFFKVVRYFLYDNWFETTIYDYPIIGTNSDNTLTKF